MAARKKRTKYVHGSWNPKHKSTSRRHSGGHGKRGLKKGHKKSAAWKKAISEGMKRYWKSGGHGHRKHARKEGTHRRKRRAHKGTMHKRRFHRTRRLRYA
jgi:hypothetical protein